jgi:dolichyl-phosphate beta-glucosyltransferase
MENNGNANQSGQNRNHFVRPRRRADSRFENQNRRSNFVRSDNQKRQGDNNQNQGNHANGRNFKANGNYKQNGNHFNNGQVYLSVVVPAYNEEKRLPQALRAIGDYLSRQKYGYEIIAVNDGSKDNTAGAVESLIGKIAKLKLIDNRANRGKGYVTRQGMLAAKGQIRLFTDSDNSTPIEEVEKLLPFFKEGYDIVIGSRDAKGAKLEPPQPMIRRFLGEGFGLMSNIVVGTWGIADTQCGFKAMTAKAAQEILPKCKIDRFAFDPEILAVAKKRGLKIKEVGILWKNDARSTVKISSMFKRFFDLLRVRLNLIKGVYGK